MTTVRTGPPALEGKALAPWSWVLMLKPHWAGEVKRLVTELVTGKLTGRLTLTLNFHRGVLRSVDATTFRHLDENAEPPRPTRRPTPKQ